ncbi:Metallo-dependent phosphatase-like protein [Aspergillus undulatus]|uniref:Metallo-dependent phosphatase-like protein n=1 Tax=Aspergillus undulatus TaxID=1810928 RepID=UPI003CCD7778
MGPVPFQILSDLHLETHPSYTDFNFPQTAPHLALLGDIGHIANDAFFTFLESQLERYSLVVYLLGNHDPYHLSFKIAKTKILSFKTRTNKRSFLGKFIFLDQTRYDLSPSLTILGCTLFSHITPSQELAVESRLVDFKDILKWTVDTHNAAHDSDLAWLNTQVSKISATEPGRKIVVFTHHSPTIDARCSDPKHVGSEVSSGFATDLSKELCWTSDRVVGWGFGHTHFNCVVELPGRLIASNQRGYRFILADGFEAGRVFWFG